MASDAVDDSLREAFLSLTVQGRWCFAFALVVAFGFEFINGFHDTANAVTTVIYTRTLRPSWAVAYSGVCNFLGVLLGGTAVAFAIVNLLPVDLLIEGASVRAIVMVISLLLAGVVWNLGAWWLGLPVSSSHTLIGSVLGVALANSLATRGNLSGVNWKTAAEVGISLLVSPLIGFAAAAGLLLAMKRVFREPKLYEPPPEGDRPPHWIRSVLLTTCGGVSLAHGSNDGQKGMGLILLTLIGFLPAYYALDTQRSGLAKEARQSAAAIEAILRKDAPDAAQALRPELDHIAQALAGKDSLREVSPSDRWGVRQAIFAFRRKLDAADLSEATLQKIAPLRWPFAEAIEFVPFWVVIGVATMLGLGTGIGYKRIVITVAEKIGKTHLTYGQGAAAEIVAAMTIMLADVYHMPVSTTHVLSSGVAGTMWANRAGVQADTLKRIGLAWVLTLPAALALSAGLFTLGGSVVGGAAPCQPTAMLETPAHSVPIVSR